MHHTDPRAAYATRTTQIHADPRRSTQIHAKLARLQQLADDHYGHDPGAVHWGQVGDLERVEQALDELLRLSLLSPTVVRALLAGKQPHMLSLIWLKNNELPWSWDDQERLFGRMDGFDSAPVAGVDCEPPRASR